jgi:hypothetical protein
MKKRKPKQQTKGIRHHAKRLYHLTPKFVHGMGIGTFVGIIVVMTFGPILPVSALSLSSPRDCDSNAVVPCGSLSTTELKQDYANKSYKGVGALYNHFGISADDIKDIDDIVVAGRVYKNGEVRVGDTVVATDAITAGRNNISGSTKLSLGGTTFYKRPPSVSFRASSIAAFVVIKDGVFKFAILAACDNPVMATAKVTPKPTPPPTPPPVEEVPEVVPTVVVKTSTQTPESTPTPAVVAAAAPLPETGPGDIGFVICLAVIGGYLYHVTHRHIRRKRHSQFA